MTQCVRAEFHDCEKDSRDNFRDPICNDLTALLRKKNLIGTLPQHPSKSRTGGATDCGALIPRQAPVPTRTPNDECKKPFCHAIRVEELKQFAFSKGLY